MASELSCYEICFVCPKWVKKEMIVDVCSFHEVSWFVAEHYLPVRRKKLLKTRPTAYGQEI